ncbi:PspC domain-containing protein [bacterium]|nr:PspC domain-containing protein [candidate division CSSED10-310 bacterium]
MSENTKSPPKRLFKSRKDKMLDGVCGGVAEYFGTDSTLVRVAWFAVCFFNGIGLWAYIISAIVMPPNPEHKDLEDKEKKTHSPHIVWGIILIVLGFLFLTRGFHFPFCFHFPFPWFHWWDFSWEFVGPSILIILGIAYIIHVLHQEKSGDQAATHTEQNIENDRKRIYRPLNERMVAGVCSGIAIHWNIDPTWVRIAYASVAILTQIIPMAIVYVVLIVVIPKSPNEVQQ